MRVKEYFDRLANDFDSLSDTAPWIEWAWRIVEEEIGSATGSFIVDLGAGTGRTIQNLLRFTRGARFLGVDFSDEMIARARQKDYGGASVEFRVGRIDRLRLPEQSVDVFTSFGTFHHVKNKRRVLKNISAMLRPGGKFVNGDLFRPGKRYLREVRGLRRRNPAAAADYDRKQQRFSRIYDRDQGHPREFHTDPYEFKELLEAAGIRPAKVHVGLHEGFALVAGWKGAPAS